ncbi:MAG: hypothetical protein HQL93_13475, partial [Magnetococcales bacterium]|nr:hypothetical protein [Magnetococcales bacterium]
IDLLDPWNHIATWCQPEGDWWKNSINFKAYTKESSFLLVITDPSCAIRLTLTCRIPEALANPGKIELCINKHPIQLIPVCAKWTTTTLLIPHQSLILGKNEITLVWPEVEMHPAPTLRFADQVEAGEVPIFFRHFGEINTLLAEPA